MTDQEKVRELLGGAASNLHAAVLARSNSPRDEGLDPVLMPMLGALANIFGAIVELDGRNDPVRERIAAAAHEALQRYARGANGVRPQDHVVGSAERVLQAALDRGPQVGASVDGTGTLRIIAGLDQGRTLVATFPVDGEVTGDLYGPDWAVERHIGGTEGEIWDALHHPDYI